MGDRAADCEGDGVSETLHYRGDRTAFDPSQILGPDRYGAHYAITAAEHDPATDVTTATLRIVPPAELAQRIDEPIEVLTKRAKVADLFIGLPPAPAAPVDTPTVAACERIAPPPPDWVCETCERHYPAEWLLKLHRMEPRTRDCRKRGEAVVTVNGRRVTP